ncbi:hypothetical protein N2152v2_006985 [Parachlorella kessleri]
MGPPRKSKRQRKQKEKHSLKYKRNSTPAGLADGLQEALANITGRVPTDSNAAVLPAKPADVVADAGQLGDVQQQDTEQLPEKQLSKSQQRKLRRIQEEKERKSRRVEVLQALSQHQLKAEELQLLRPVASLGQKETKRQALRRALQLERAGLPVPKGARLLQERRTGREEAAGGAAAAFQGEDSDDSTSEDEGAARTSVLVLQGVSGGHALGSVDAGGTLPACAVSGSSDGTDSGSGSEGEGGSRDEVQAPPTKKARVSRLAARQTAAQLREPYTTPREDTPPDGPAAGEEVQAQRSTQQQQQQQQQEAAVAAAKRELGLPPSGSEAGGDEAEEAGGTAGRRQRGQQGMVGGPGGKARVVMVRRRPEIDAVREGLPITGQEQEIMEAVLENDVVVLCGETGCGKTTQVPQFLYEAGFGCKDFPERSGAVGVTQPRRVAAIATAERVADELDTRLGQVVGYQVRYDKRVGGETAIKFMTDGILLRELQSDFLLRRYSAIVIDEAHERSLNTDILLGMLSRIVRLRRQLSAARDTGEAQVYPLKLIIMSATLRTEDFVSNTRLFPEPPPVVTVPARQYPVTVHFSKRTEMHDYVGAAFKKVSQIHRTLPPGGVLVFLTGQREVEHLCARLRAAFSKPKGRAQGQGTAVKESGRDQQRDGSKVAGQGEQQPEMEGAELDAFSADAAEADASTDANMEDLLLDDRLGAADMHDDFEAESSGDEADVVVLGGEGFTPEEIQAAEKDFEQRLGIDLSALKAGGGSGNSRRTGLGGDPGNEGVRDAGPVHVLPLYAMLPPAQQARVFRPGPPGARVIVVATNVAETSLTIPGIRYVVDSGRSKQRLLESAAGLARYEVRWVSKASAEQRAGRAGRTGPGHCYRLYSSAHFNDTFPRHTPPEIVNTALEGVVLTMKALGVDKVTNFPFPSPPEPEALQAAERCLVALSALDPALGQLTELGKAMAAFPVSPRHARMLLEAAMHDTARSASAAAGKKRKKGGGAAPGAAAEGGAAVGVLRYAVALAAALSVDSPFVHVDAVQAGEGTTATDDGSPAEAAAAKEHAKAARRAAHEAHAKFRVADSDALSALRALCAFEAAGEDQGFCSRNHLHFRNLREAAALHKQLAHTLLQQQQQQAQQQQGQQQQPLQRLLAGCGPLLLGAVGDQKAQLSALTVEALRRALAAGWADQVAKRVRALEYLQSQAAGGGRRGHRAVRYRSCALDEEVYLHPNSALHATCPELVAYTELVRTAKRPYMAGLTAIEPPWLPEVAAPLCEFSEPLEDPPPAYRPGSDQVVCWRQVTFGKHGWQLPPSSGPHPDPQERCAVFAAALLEGRVLPAMQGLRKGLAIPPSMILRPDTRVHRRVADLLSALLVAGVDSRASLGRKWAENPGFLQQELLAWMQKAQAPALLGSWQQLQRECGVAPQQQR